MYGFPIFKSHYISGPWTIIFSDLMGDLAKFATILMIFMFGFNMVVLSMNQPYFALTGIGLLPWPYHHEWQISVKS